MADESAAVVTVTVEQVPSIHVVKGVAHSISTDGTTAMLKFEQPDGQEVAMTLPTPMLGAVRAMAGAAMNEAYARGWYKPPAMLNLRYIGDWAGVTGIGTSRGYEVGHSDHIRGAVAITFDPREPDEVIYIMRDREALAYAGAIRADVLGRTPPGERAALEARAGAARIILPHQG